MASAYPPMSPPPLPEPPVTPTSLDPEVKRAREEQKKRAAAMAGYASTIATGGQGLTDPASTTAAPFGTAAGATGGKTLLGA